MYVFVFSETIITWLPVLTPAIYSTHITINLKKRIGIHQYPRFIRHLLHLPVFLIEEGNFRHSINIPEKTETTFLYHSTYFPQKLPTTRQWWARAACKNWRKKAGKERATMLHIFRKHASATLALFIVLINIQDDAGNLR